jgi:hypothetical protein
MLDDVGRMELPGDREKAGAACATGRDLTAVLYTDGENVVRDVCRHFTHLV